MAQQEQIARWLVERLRVIFPEVEIQARATFPDEESELFEDRYLGIEIRSRRFKKEEWREVPLPDDPQSAVYHCQSLHIRLVIPPNEFAIDSDPERAVQYRRSLLSRCVNAWIEHRLAERGLSTQDNGVQR